MLSALILLAQAGGEEPAKTPEGPGPLGFFFPIIMMFVVFYLLIIVPGRRERKQRQSMLTLLKKNDKIITHGGIIGVITNLKEGTEEMTIKSEDTKLLILKSSVARVYSDADSQPPKEGQPGSTAIKPAP